MSIKTHKKIGFFISLAMLLGSVVGIGIFLKNHSVLKANDWSGAGTLVSWVIGGLLALTAAISFSEIAGQKSGQTTGLNDWAEKAGGKKFGFIVRTNYPMFYFSILTMVLAMFAAETIFSIFTSILGVDMPHFGFIAIVGVAILAITTAINFWSVKASGIIQSITVVLKFVPLVLVAIVGLALATTNHNPSGNFGQNAFTNGQAFDFTKMLAALPAVLFAYDAFLTVAQIKNKMKNEDQLPLIVALGMTIVVGLYMLIALSAIMHGSGMVSGGLVGAPPEVGLGIFDQIFSGKTAQAFGTFVIIFLAISTYGVLNGLSTASVYTYMMLAEVNAVFGMKKLKEKFGTLKTAIIYISATSLFYFLIFIVPAIAVNNDAIIDASSNFPTLFFFLIYALTILGYMIKRKNLKHKKINNIFFMISATFAVGGIIFLSGYQLFYGLTIQLLLDPETKSSAGLFAASGDQFNNIHMFIIFVVSLVIFVSIPIINWALIKYVEKREPIVSTQTVE